MATSSAPPPKKAKIEANPCHLGRLLIPTVSGRNPAPAQHTSMPHAYQDTDTHNRANVALTPAIVGCTSQ